MTPTHRLTVDLANALAAGNALSKVSGEDPLEVVWEGGYDLMLNMDFLDGNGEGHGWIRLACLKTGGVSVYIIPDEGPVETDFEDAGVDVAEALSNGLVQAVRNFQAASDAAAHADSVATTRLGRVNVLSARLMELESENDILRMELAVARGEGIQT